MKTLTVLLCWLALALPTLASPGAHGPNGEHLDAPVAASAGSVPRVETFTEDFELVGHLSGGELSVLIDRYDSNEPVLGGRLEVQLRDIKAQARFHAAGGDYAFDDPRLLQALAKPGQHQLLFTFVAGDESDLLQGTLDVPAAAAPANTGRPRWPYWAAGAVGLLFLGALLLHRRSSRTPR